MGDAFYNRELSTAGETGYNAKKPDVCRDGKDGGSNADRFSEATGGMLEQLGTAFGQIHRKSAPFFGEPGNEIPLERFHSNLADVLTGLVYRFYPDDSEAWDRLPEMVSLARCLPSPAFGSWIKIDLDPTQFLADGHRLTALVDTEAFVVGPREWDLIALEYLLDSTGVDAFEG